MGILSDIRVPSIKDTIAECDAVDARVMAMLDTVQTQMNALLVLYNPPKNRRATDKPST